MLELLAREVGEVVESEPVRLLPSRVRFVVDADKLRVVREDRESLRTLFRARVRLPVRREPPIEARFDRRDRVERRRQSRRRRRGRRRGRPLRLRGGGGVGRRRRDGGREGAYEEERREDARERARARGLRHRERTN